MRVLAVEAVVVSVWLLSPCRRLRKHKRWRDLQGCMWLMSLRALPAVSCPSRTLRFNGTEPLDTTALASQRYERGSESRVGKSECLLRRAAAKAMAGMGFIKLRYLPSRFTHPQAKPARKRGEELRNYYNRMNLWSAVLACDENTS